MANRVSLKPKVRREDELFLFNLNYKKNSCHDSKRSEWFIKSRAVAQAFYEGRTRRVRPTNVGAVEGANRRFATATANRVSLKP